MKKSLIYFLLFVPPLIFYTDLTRNPYYFQITLLNIVVSFLWIIFLFEFYKNREIEIRFGKIDIPLLIFFVFSFLTLAISYFRTHNYPFPEIIEEGKKVINCNYLKSSIFSEGLKKVIFSISNVVLVYYLVLNFLKKEEIKKTYHIIFLAGFVASIYGILQYFGVETIWPKILNPYGGRCVSTFGNPNFISSYLILLIPVIFSFLLFEKKNIWKEVNLISILLGVVLVFLMFLLGEQNPNLFIFLILFIGIVFFFSFFPRLAYYVVLFVYFICLLCTLTRSSWLGLSASFFFFFLLFLKKIKNLQTNEKKTIMTVFFGFLIAILFFPRSNVPGYHPTIVERVVEITKAKDEPYGGVHQRLLIWSCGWQMIKENFFFGKGWGCFELFYPFYQGKFLFMKTIGLFRTHANNAHNEILEIWSQTGTLGFGLYIWFLILLFIFCIKALKNLPSETKLLYIGVFSSILGMLVDNLLNVSLHFCIPAFLYWWNIGVLMKLSGESNVSIRFRKVYFIFFIPLIFIIINFIFRFYGEMNYFKGFKYSKKEELEKAQIYLEKAEKLQLEVNNNYELANTYARKKLIDKAIWAYYKSLAANCGYDEIHFNLATVYLQKNEIQKSILNYTQALYINPISKEAYLALGNIFLKNIEENKERCIKLFTQATKIFPQEKDFYNNLGYLYMKKNDIENAISSYKKAIEIDPSFEPARYNLAMLLKKIGRKDVYLEYQELLNLANEKIKNKSWEEVIQISKKMVNIFPNDFTATFYLANSYFMLGKFSDAIEEYKKAKKINPQNVHLLTNLALAYLQINEHKLAKEEFENVLKIEPNNQIAKEKLQLIK